MKNQMKRAKLVSIVGISLLASCQRDPQPVAARFCEKVADSKIDEVSSCIHKTAYQFASAPDASSVVAKAVARACVPAIVRLVQRNVKAGFVDGSDFEAQDRMIENAQTARTDEALYRVVQARAGHCATP